VVHLLWAATYPGRISLPRLLSTLLRRLVRQASLSQQDPNIGACVPDGSPEVMDIPMGVMASASWGDQLDAISPLLEDSSNDLVTPLPGFLIGDRITGCRQRFLHPLRPGHQASCRGIQNRTRVDLQDMCKCAAKLVIPWSNAVTETTMSRYEGKLLPKDKIGSQAITTIVPRMPIHGSTPVFSKNCPRWVNVGMC
jgi:hypothetical protein